MTNLKDSLRYGDRQIVEVTVMDGSKSPHTWRILRDKPDDDDVAMLTWPSWIDVVDECGENAHVPWIVITCWNGQQIRIPLRVCIVKTCIVKTEKRRQ